MRSSAEHGDAFIFPTDPSLTRRVAAVGLLTAATSLFAGPALAQTAPGQTGSDQTLPEAPPLEEETRLTSNLLTRMAARAEINGQPGFAFVLDTGAGRTAITRDVAEALKLPSGPQILVHGLTSAELTPTARISRLNFGGRRFTDIYAGVYPRSLLGADGLMGLDVLSRFELQFDLVKRTMSLTPSGPDRVEFGVNVDRLSHIRSDSATRTRIGRFGQLILISARVEDIQVDCFIDSGAQYSIGNLALLRAVAPGLMRPSERVMVPVYGVTGQTILAEHADVGRLGIGTRRLGPTSLLFADLHAFEILGLNQRPALLLGADTLSRFRRVSLDFGRSRMDFGAVRRTQATMTRS